MKKLILLIIVTVFCAFLVNAQTESVLKSEIKTNKTDKKIYKDKKRQDRKELRALEGTKVSEQALQQFSRDFGNLQIEVTILMKLLLYKIVYNQKHIMMQMLNSLAQRIL